MGELRNSTASSAARQLHLSESREQLLSQNGADPRWKRAVTIIQAFARRRASLLLFRAQWTRAVKVAKTTGMLLASVRISRMAELPLAIIDDPGFWRYLSLVHFWWLAQWRHPSAFESNDPALYLRYVDGVLTTECVLSRMYLRAQIAEIDGDYSLTTAVAQGSDFWRSHILRVSTGASPPLSRALLREQSERRMPTDQARALARDLNRISSNIVLSIYDEEDAAALLTELREQGQRT